MSYESPIDIIYGDMQTKLEGDVFKVIQNCNIKVDKDELLKALAYDRNQYHKGWLDGYAQAEEDIVRCKDCKYAQKEFFSKTLSCRVWGDRFFPEDFCSTGKRRDLK